MTKFLLAFYLFYFNNTLFAKCVDESKTVEICLQCCTDTALVSELKKQKELVTDVAKACKVKETDNQVDLTSKEAKAVYLKYKIDGATINFLCAGDKLEPEVYRDCVLSCKSKFKKEKKSK